MKPFSLLDIYDCKAYLRVDFDFDDYLIEMMLDAAKSYVKNYTKRTQEDLDNIPEVSLCVLVIMAHLYDHRTLEADSDIIDYTISKILGCHWYYMSDNQLKGTEE